MVIMFEGIWVKLLKDNVYLLMVIVAWFCAWQIKSY